MTRRSMHGAALALAVLAGWPVVVSAQGAQPAAGGIAAVPPANAPEPPALQYTVRPSDTPIRIGRELLEHPADWTEVLRINDIRDPRRMAIGRTLTIPGLLLKSQPSLAVVETVSGEASVDGRPLAAGDRIGETASVRTGPSTVVVLRLSDGSTLRLAPASQLRLERLRRYHDDRIVEARILLERGRIETAVAPGRRKPVEVRTPLATAAVRGTTFRVGHLDSLASAEVLGGEVGWGSAARPTALPGGYGATADPAGVRPPEKLLDAPAFAITPTRIDSPSMALPFSPVEGAQAYRIQWSLDPAFGSLLHEAVVPKPVAALRTDRDGIHHLRVRAIAASRLEGYDGAVAIDVHARPQPPAPGSPRSGTVTFDDRVQLAWAPSGGATDYQLELAADAGFTQPLKTERITGTQATVPLKIEGSSLPRERWWRVAGVDAVSGRVGPFGAPMRIDWRPGLPTPSIQVDDLDTVRVRWSGRDDERYRVEIASDPAFGTLARTLDARAATPGIAEAGTEGLAPGRWYARLRGGPVTGPQAPPSKAVAFTIAEPVRGHGSVPLRTGTGLPVWKSPDDR